MNSVESIQEDFVPIETLRKISDAHACEVWNENVGGGKPVPLFDAMGLYAYVFPYILNSKQFPADETVLKKIRALRKQYKVDAYRGSSLSAYYTELRQLGENFGAVCMSATCKSSPILWVSHFLSRYYIMIDLAMEEAKRQTEGEVNFLKYYYLSPEQQYMEFKSGDKTITVDACTPNRNVPKDVLTAKPREPKSAEIAAEIRKSWERLIGKNMEECASPEFSPGTGVAPRGIIAEDIAQTHTLKKIPYWELIPMVDHTPKDWCVPASWAMVLGFYDNYVKGKGTLLGYGRLIDYWYELTPGGFNLPNLADDVLPPKDAAAINNYKFLEKKTSGNQTDLWNALKTEIDAGKPCFFNIPGHCTAAFGYRVDNNGNKYAIVYDPPNPQTRTYEREYNFTECNIISSLTVSGGTNGDDIIIIAPDGGEDFYTCVPGEIIWYVFGGGIKMTRLSVSEDGGNCWETFADNIPAKGAWNGYAWIPEKSGARLRVKVEGYDATDGLVAADGSFENFSVKSPASGKAWKKIWGPTDFALISSVSWAKSSAIIFAVPSTQDGIYQYDGVTLAWTKIGGPGKMFALDDSAHLYGLSPDGSGVYSYTGSPNKWTQIGGPASAIYAGGNSVFATNPQTGDIYEYSGKPMSWTKIGGPGKTFAVDGSGRLYGVSPDGSGVYRYDDLPMKWTKIAGTTYAIYAGGCGLYATSSSMSDVTCYSLVPSVWNAIGGPGKMFAVDDVGRIFGLSPDGSGVYRYEGSWKNLRKWSKIGDAAGKIFVGGNGRLLATNPQTHDLMSFE